MMGIAITDYIKQHFLDWPVTLVQRVMVSCQSHPLFCDLPRKAGLMVSSPRLSDALTFTVFD